MRWARISAGLLYAFGAPGAVSSDSSAQGARVSPTRATLPEGVLKRKDEGLLSVFPLLTFPL
jgi:hypothetical protein